VRRGDEQHKSEQYDGQGKTEDAAYVVPPVAGFFRAFRFHPDRSGHAGETTGTAASISSITAAAEAPFARSSCFRIIRWDNTGRANSFTSSGMT
jgi:hypothetical protein